MPAKKGRKGAARAAKANRPSANKTSQAAQKSGRVNLQEVRTSNLRATGRIADLGRIWAGIDRLKKEFRLSFVRPDDFLVCDLIFENFQFDPQAKQPTLVRKNSQDATTMIVEFPPQSFGEQVFL